MLVHVAKYSLVISMIEDGIEHKTVYTSIITSSKPFKFSHADCDYLVAPESLKFFIMVHQVTPIVSSFSECLKLFF